MILKKYFFIIFLFLGFLLTIHSKIADPFPIIYKNFIYTSHLNIVYKYDASTITQIEVDQIINRKKMLTDDDKITLNDDDFICAKLIWKKEIYRYIQPIIPLDQYVNFICKLEINNDILRIENSKGDIYYLDADTGINISKNVSSDKSMAVILFFLGLISIGLLMFSIYRKKTIKN